MFPLQNLLPLCFTLESLAGMCCGEFFFLIVFMLKFYIFECPIISLNWGTFSATIFQVKFSNYAFPFNLR